MKSKLRIVTKQELALGYLFSRDEMEFDSFAAD